MKKITTFLIFSMLLMSAFVKAQSYTYDWAFGVPGSQDDQVKCSAVDASGDLYVAGYFSSSSLTFGSATITNTNTSYDVFIVKYNSSGTAQWAKKIGGSGIEDVHGIAIDGTGNVVVTGTFRSPSLIIGSTTLTNTSASGSTEDIFVAKYSSSGTSIWAKSAGTSNTDYAYGIACSSGDNVYITGSYNGASIIFGSTTLTNSGSDDVFIAKYNSSGTVQWAKSAIGSSFEAALCTAVDASENVIIAGSFASSTVTFGSTVLTRYPLTSNGTDIFLVKYNSSGTVVWARSYGSGKSETAFAVATDVSGNIYMTGEYNSTELNFDAVGTFNSYTPYDGYVVKLNSSGTGEWAKGIGHNGTEKGVSVKVGNGKVYVAGEFNSSSINFGVTSIPKVGVVKDFFIFEYDVTGGTEGWYTNSGDVGSIAQINHDATGNMYVCGNVNSQVVLGTNTILNSNIFSDFFVARLANTIGIYETDANAGFGIYPNPYNERTTFDFKEEQLNTSIKITDILGKEIKSLNFTGRHLVIEKGEMKSGIYFVQTIDDRKHVNNRKMVIQ